MKVLVKLEQLLFWTFLFQDKPYKLRSIQIPYLILNFICAVPLLALIVLMNHRIYLVISNDGSFDDISYEAYMNLGATTTTLSYFSYVQNIPLIILIIQSTQTIVRKSEFIDRSMVTQNWNFHWYIFNFRGWWKQPWNLWSSWGQIRKINAKNIFIWSFGVNNNIYSTIFSSNCNWCFWFRGIKKTLDNTTSSCVSISAHPQMSNMKLINVEFQSLVGYYKFIWILFVNYNTNS